MVTGAIERLDTRLKQHAVRDQLQSLLADHLNALIPAERACSWARYEQTCERTLFQVINELKERQAAAADYRRQAFLLPEFRPSASLLTALRSSSELNNDAELAESDGDHDGGGEAELEVQVVRDGLVEGEHLVRNEASRGLGGWRRLEAGRRMVCETEPVGESAGARRWKRGGGWTAKRSQSGRGRCAACWFRGREWVSNEPSSVARVNSVRIQATRS